MQVQELDWRNSNPKVAVLEWSRHNSLARSVSDVSLEVCDRAFLPLRDGLMQEEGTQAIKFSTIHPCQRLYRLIQRGLPLRNLVEQVHLPRQLGVAALDDFI